METGLDRREFLKTTVATGAFLMAGSLLKGVPQAQGLVKIPESEKIVITVITDNLSDVNRTDYKIAKRLTKEPYPLNAAAHAEHGLAYQIETVVGGEYHCGLFDFGTDPHGIMKNMNLLKIELGKVEALGISHDHWDHQTAFVEIMKAKKDEFRKSIPLYVGDQFFVGTYQRLANGNIISLTDLKKNDVEALDFVKITEINGPTPFIPGAYFTGKVEQITNYETVPSIYLVKKGNEYIHETFPGEQALVLNVKGKGLIVLSACAHRGIVNTVKHAQKMTGVDKVYLLMGGFHLINAKPELIQRTVADIKAINPEYIVPTHCTGYEAISAFSKEMPNQFILNTAGTKYIIEG